MPRAASRPLSAVAVILLSAALPVGAINIQIDNPTLAQALAIARQGDAARAAFHQRYTAVIGDSTYDRVEVIGEFRRAVLIAEEQLKIDPRWDASQTRAALTRYRGFVTFVLWVKFPPQNLLVGIPNYELVVYPAGAPTPDVLAKGLRDKTPGVTALYPAGGGNVLVGPPGGAMGGARLESVFPASSLSLTGRYTVGILLDGELQRRVDFNLGALQ